MENATSVSINNGVGTVALTGTQSVSPATTTTYTLTATNASDPLSAMRRYCQPWFRFRPSLPSPPVRLPHRGRPEVTLTCDTNNAVNVNVAGGMFFGANDSFPVFPTVLPRYTCIATNQLGQSRPGQRDGGGAAVHRPVPARRRW